MSILHVITCKETLIFWSTTLCWICGKYSDWNLQRWYEFYFGSVVPTLLSPDASIYREEGQHLEPTYLLNIPTPANDESRFWYESHWTTKIETLIIHITASGREKLRGDLRKVVYCTITDITVTSFTVSGHLPLC